MNTIYLHINYPGLFKNPFQYIFEKEIFEIYDFNGQPDPLSNYQQIFDKFPQAKGIYIYSPFSDPKWIKNFIDKYKKRFKIIVHSSKAVSFNQDISPTIKNTSNNQYPECYIEANQIINEYLSKPEPVNWTEFDPEPIQDNDFIITPSDDNWNELPQIK